MRRRAGNRHRGQGSALFHRAGAACAVCSGIAAGALDRRREERRNRHCRGVVDLGRVPSGQGAGTAGATNLGSTAEDRIVGDPPWRAVRAGGCRHGRAGRSRCPASARSPSASAVIRRAPPNHGIGKGALAIRHGRWHRAGGEDEGGHCAPGRSKRSRRRSLLRGAWTGLPTARIGGGSARGSMIAEAGLKNRKTCCATEVSAALNSHP